ncbi:hypothetical protein C8Q74DRAFT_1220232 [Fomes fomentarius]|nr:hypothetical protein C8Q74DRAFT_1220232 [Fomes fomentarius]
MSAIVAGQDWYQSSPSLEEEGTRALPQGGRALCLHCDSDFMFEFTQSRLSSLFHSTPKPALTYHEVEGGYMMAAGTACAPCLLRSSHCAKELALESWIDSQPVSFKLVIGLISQPFQPSNNSQCSVLRSLRLQDADVHCRTDLPQRDVLAVSAAAADLFYSHPNSSDGRTGCSKAPCISIPEQRRWRMGKTVHQGSNVETLRSMLSPACCFTAALSYSLPSRLGLPLSVGVHVQSGTVQTQGTTTHQAHPVLGESINVDEMG